MRYAFKMNFELDKPTVNNRIYNTENFKEKIEEFLKKDNTYLIYSGVRGHSVVYDVENIVAKIANIDIENDGSVIVEVDPLHTPKAEKFFASISDDNIEVWVSPNMIGILDEKTMEVDVESILYFYAFFENKLLDTTY